MKRILHIFVLFHLMLFGTDAISQAPAPQPLVYGSSPFQDSLWSIDTTNWQVVNRMGPTLAGFTITGMNGLAMDPTTGITYIIMKVSAVSGRVLGTIDLQTGICTQVGNLGDNFSSIMFTSDGQLWGATGNGAAAPETLYKIDKATGIKTLMYAMGNGADGEIICYNPSNNLIYHWSGNSTMVMESMSPAAVTYTPTNIPIIGTAGGETFGSFYLNPSTIITSSISSNFHRTGINGSYSNFFASLPDDLRGLVMPPRFTSTPTTICENSAFSVRTISTQLFDSIIYNWGDGNIDTLAVGDGTHIYTVAGSYNVDIRFRPIGGTGFSVNPFKTFPVVVNPTPIVVLSGNSALCPSGTNMLVASALGTLQWYMNGTIIIDSISSALFVSSPGVYNPIATNSFGCSDSAAVGINVISVPSPVVNLGGDQTVCGGVTLDAGNVGSTYAWNTAATTQTLAVTATGPYDVTVTDANGCIGTDNVTITVNALPAVTLGPDQTVCGSVTLDAGNAGSTFLWSTSGTNQTENASSTGTYSVTVTDVNGCSSSDAIDITVNALPVVALGPDQTVCGGITLDAGNAGSTFLWNTSGTNQTENASSTGTYSVTVTDANGCSSSDAIDITVNSLPVVDLGIDVTACGSTLISPNMSGTFLWSDNSTGPNLTVTASGTYSVVVTDGNGCSGSDAVSVTINPLPTVTVTSAATACIDDANVTLVGSPAGGIYSGPSVTGNTFDPSIGAGVQTINYAFTDANGCSASATTSITVSACVGIQEQHASVLSVYPNPANAQIVIDIPASGAKMEIFDILGNAVYSQAEMNAGKTTVNVSNYAEGTYFVRVSMNEKVTMNKILVQH